MNDAIVVLNAGSSSLKFSVFRIDGSRLEPVVKGLIEGIGTNPRFKAKDADGRVVGEAQPQAPGGSFGQSEALRFLLQWLQEHYQHVSRVVAVGHRVVHGGSEFIEPT